MFVAKLIIVFQGLMLFQSTSGSKHVAIVDPRDESYHHANIQIRRDANPIAPIPLRAGDVVELDVAPGEITRDDLYRAHVPKLREFITTGDVDAHVVKDVIKDGVLAYFALPPGALTTWGTFVEPVRLTRRNGNETTRCFARFVVLQTEITNEVTMTVTHTLTPTLAPDSFTIRPTDLLMISNIAPHGTHEPHFPLYQHLLTPGGTLGPVLILGNEDPCPTMDGVGKLDQHVENVLTPEREAHAPNGDCGPTGP
jgi:hypothetical protein